MKWNMFFLNGDSVNTNVWMLHMDANKTQGEEAR